MSAISAVLLCVLVAKASLTSPIPVSQDFEQVRCQH